MRKLPYTYITLTLQMIIITFFIIILSGVTLTAESRSFFKNRMLSENAQGVNVKDESIELSDIARCIDSKSVLYKSISDENQTKRAVYLTGDVFGFEKYIESGRFFTNEDCKSPLPMAVIGSDVKSDTINKDGKLYYGCDGVLYSVTGIFEKTDSDLDRCVYLNMSYILSAYDSSGVYYIDGQNAEKVSLSADSFAKHTGGSVFEYERVKNDINAAHKIKFALAVAAAFCNLLMTAHYFAAKQNHKIAVKKLCGQTNRSMVTEYAVRISAVTAAAYLIGCVLAVALTHFTLSFAATEFSASSFMTAFAMVVVSGVILIFQLGGSAAKVNISDVLKG